MRPAWLQTRGQGWAHGLGLGCWPRQEGAAGPQLTQAWRSALSPHHHSYQRPDNPSPPSPPHTAGSHHLCRPGPGPLTKSSPRRGDPGRPLPQRRASRHRHGRLCAGALPAAATALTAHARAPRPAGTCSSPSAASLGPSPVLGPEGGAGRWSPPSAAVRGACLLSFAFFERFFREKGTKPTTLCHHLG